MKVGVLTSYPQKSLRIFDADYWSVNSEANTLTIASEDNGAIALFNHWDAVCKFETAAQVRRMLLVKKVEDE